MTDNLRTSKIQARDGKGNEHFGHSVSLSGNVALVGAYGANSAGADAGAAYLFNWQSDGTWKEVQKLLASDKQAADHFGSSVSLDGNRAIVGAFYEDSGGINAGAAYLFERQSDGTWKEVQKLQASDRRGGSDFGRSLSLSGNFVIVGAPYQDTGARNAGAAYLFERQSEALQTSDGTWKEVQKLQASDRQRSDLFGWSVSISGNLAIVGAPFEDTGGTNAGAAYLFERQGDGTWKEVQKLQAKDRQAHDQFGYSVSISGNRAIVGADIKNSGGTYAGAAYLFERLSDGTWKETQKVQGHDTQAGDKFGSSVLISGNIVLVGARLENSGGTDAGAAYLFERLSDGTWKEVQKLQASDPRASDQFGVSVSLDGPWAIVGAEYGDGKATNSGAAYLFEWSPEPENPPTQPGHNSGSTPLGNTNWQQYELGKNDQGIFIDIDTSAAAFTETPKYFTALRGEGDLSQVKGVHAIYNASPTGFRIYLYRPDQLTPEFANQHNWHIQWLGMTECD